MLRSTSVHYIRWLQPREHRNRDESIEHTIPFAMIIAGEVPATAEEAEEELPPPGDPMKMLGFPVDR